MGQRTETLLIGASIDDADCSNLGTIDYTSNSVECEDNQDGFFRFQLSGIYPDATINSAYLKLTSYGAQSDDFDPRIYIEDVDNSAQFGTTENLQLRTMWGTYVTWNAGAWSATVQYTSPDIKTLIQHVIDRVGYSFENYITLKMDSTNADKSDDGRDAYSWDYDNANSTLHRAVLEITHSHACNVDATTGNIWINTTTGSCTLLKSSNKAGSVLVEDGQYLDMNGFNLTDLDGTVSVKDSGSKILIPSGSVLKLIN